MGSRSQRKINNFSVGLITVCLLFLPIGGLQAQTVCAPDVLDIRSETSVTRFSVEIADTVETRARGLMNRPTMPRFAGMLFVYDKAQPVSFWMRNTLIPLDMIFVDATGIVQTVHENAIPLDETAIPGGAAIKYVFEINGGMAKTLGITVGSALRHPAISGNDIFWPCK